MNKFKILFSIHILLFLLFSCKSSGNSEYYKQLISSYSPEFVGHFPGEIRKGRVDLIENGEYDVTRLLLLIEEPESQVISIEDSLIKKALAQYSSSDTCLFVVNKFTTEKNYSQQNKATLKDIDKYLNSECIHDKLPIANFWGLFKTSDVLSLSQLPDGFKIYVLDAKKGLYWDQSHRSSGKYMPDFWKHGFSKGIAINPERHQLVYWFVLW